MFRIDEIVDPVCSFKLGNKEKPDFVMEETLMETMKINGDLYFVLTGTIIDTHI